MEGETKEIFMQDILEMDKDELIYYILELRKVDEIKLVLIENYVEQVEILKHLNKKLSAKIKTLTANIESFDI